jgi:hypothetical protein
VQFVQPDLSKTGGVTEANADRRDGQRAEAVGQPAHLGDRREHGDDNPLLCAVDNPGYFEGDVTSFNPFRDHLADRAPYALDAEGCVRPHDAIGVGLKTDQDFIAEHPLIEGPCYV